VSKQLSLNVNYIRTTLTPQRRINSQHC